MCSLFGLMDYQNKLTTREKEPHPEHTRSRM